MENNGHSNRSPYRRHKIDPWGRDDIAKDCRERLPEKSTRDKYRRNSRSISRERRRSQCKDLYKEIVDKDHEYRERNRRKSPSYRDRRSRDRYRSRSPYKRRKRSRSGSDDSYEYQSEENNQIPNPKLIVRGLAQHITEADINSDILNCGLKPMSVRLIRKSKTGASRGFAFVEFNTADEAKHWMNTRQGLLVLQDHYKATIHYSYSVKAADDLTDWYCGKCGVFNFKRRETCFKCNASREMCAGEGSDEISNVLTKKIILRNLDVLTNEERVLTVMQEVVPSLAPKISQILICRDSLTSTSRGICYLIFDNLVDSMNTHNALKACEPPLKIDNKIVQISYCIDGDIGKKVNLRKDDTSLTNKEEYDQFTLADINRLAEYSAGLYATNSAELAYYIKYYTEYYTSQISNGNNSNIPTQAQLGAAVAQSAIHRKLVSKNDKDVPTKIIELPKGNDGIKYPQPNKSSFLYDETSGCYYDPVSGLYYCTSSGCYYNNETGVFLLYDQQSGTYIVANNALVSQPKVEEKKEENKQKEDKPQDKVKVAKKIVKDMEKWAKQLNQKKDMCVVSSSSSFSREENKPTSSKSSYADVGFSILEKKDRNLTGIITSSKLVSYGSDSDDEKEARTNSDSQISHEKGYVDLDKLTCNLCKRAFPSNVVLQKHLTISQLHKDNLQKYNLLNLSKNMDSKDSIASNYRDRAKERRQKYGEVDPPPPNRIRERYERQMERQKSANQPKVSVAPIDEGNIGNRLLQKMGWSEGQGLGRKNQGRTDIIEAQQRNPSAGLGSTSSAVAGDDYKTYIKKMMKSRYEQAGVMD